MHAPAPILVATLLAACSGDGAREGARLYSTLACVQCHGGAGQGTPTAPPLTGVAEHWTREELVDYLADPGAFVQRDPRLRELKARYATVMPATTISEGKRRLLAEHVLGLSDPAP